MDWFKKGYSPAKFAEDINVNMDDIDAVFSESTVRHFRNYCCWIFARDGCDGHMWSWKVEISKFYNKQHVSSMYAANCYKGITEML